MTIRLAGHELKESWVFTVTVLNVGQPKPSPLSEKHWPLVPMMPSAWTLCPTDSILWPCKFAAQAEGYDLILMGRESIDYNSGGARHGERIHSGGLGVPVMKLDIEGTTVKMQRVK